LVLRVGKFGWLLRLRLLLMLLLLLLRRPARKIRVPAC
jgi:hypothetical protein